MRRVKVVLPNAISAHGAWVRDVTLREMNGYDEELLDEMGDSPDFLRSITLLKNVVELQRTTREDKENFLTKLTLGDVTALILQLRKTMFGNVLQCVINCPACKAEMSIDLNINQLIQKSSSHPKPEYDARVDGYNLKLRPLTVGDVEHLSGEKEEKERTRRGTVPKKRSEEILMRSCIISSRPHLPKRCGEKLLSQISAKLSELDPQADLLLNLTCPTCKHRFQTPFFPEDFLLREIDARTTQFQREVHWLAFNYHWNEKDILSLPVSRRKQYVELINRTLSGESV